MKKIFVLLCGLLVNIFSFPQTAPSSPKLYTREEALKIWSPFINIIGKNKMLEALNAATGLSSFVSEEDLARFHLAILLTPPLNIITLGTVIISLTTAGLVAKGMYTVAKDLTKGAYILTKDGIIVLKEVAKGSAYITKEICTLLFCTSLKENSLNTENKELDSLQEV